MSTPIRLQAWKVINAEVRRKISTRDAELLALIERAEADLRQGWIEAAADALARARTMLVRYAEGARHE